MFLTFNNHIDSRSFIHLITSNLSKIKILLLIFTLVSSPGHSQNFDQWNWDNQWILGFDSNNKDSIGQAISIDFNSPPPIVTSFTTVKDFWMEGSNSSFSDQNGNLKFYTNGCIIINGAHDVMENGYGINPGIIDEFWCPYGGSPIPQGIISIPAPGHANLVYIFNLDLGLPYFGIDTFTGTAPVTIYYQLVDIDANNGLGSVVDKNVVVLQDTFARGTIQGAKHFNDTDWWIIVPKSHSNCYFLTLVTAEGIDTILQKCAGHVWNDNDAGQSVFSPDGSTFCRVNYQNGLSIFSFNDNTGDLVEREWIDFSEDYFPTTSGIAISSNSRFVYISAGKKLYQFDLDAGNIGASKLLIANSDSIDGVFFNKAELAPDNKIYISNSNTHKYLHVINSPNCHGLNCDAVINGLELPSDNYLSIPNFPHFRSYSNTENCDTINSSISLDQESNILIYPNPTLDEIKVEIPEINDCFNYAIYDISGKLLFTGISCDGQFINLVSLENGVYLMKIQLKNISTARMIFKN